MDASIGSRGELVPVDRGKQGLAAGIWSLTADRATGNNDRLAEADESSPGRRGVPGALEKLNITRVDGSQTFDGNNLCHVMRGEMQKIHRGLQDPSQRLTFEKYWSKTCDEDRRLATESGADKVVQQMISSMHERFDHYFDRSGYQSLQNALAGTDIGIGIETEIRGAGQLRTPQPYEALISREHPLEVREVLPDSPAAKAGLQVGDRILAVNGVPTDGLKRRQALEHTEGTRDANVQLTVARLNNLGNYETKEFTAREQLLPREAAEYKNLGDGIGYVRLNNFIADDAGDKMFWALGKTEGDKAIVIDLRNNSGGKVSNMEQIAELIMSKGELYREEVRSGDELKIETRSLSNGNLILSSKTANNPQPSQTLSIPQRADRVVPEDKPIVVLVDEYSASASELLAGTLQANNRAIVVGVPTTGKSEGQELIELPYARGAALTDFEFFPGGRPVPHSGLKPDIVAEIGADPRVDDQLAQAKKAAADLFARSSLQTRAIESR